MGRLVDITWPTLNINVVAELADDLNPELCDDFWASLPFTVLQDHPIVSGETIFAWAPLVSTARVRHRERIDQAPIGRIRFSQGTGNKFSIQYGKGLESLSAPVLGRVVPASVDVLPLVGKAIWESTCWTKDLIWVTVCPHGAPDTHRAQAEPTHPVAKAFAHEASRITTVEPEDLERLRQGKVGSAGSFGQYFGPWVHADGMLRDYVMYTLYPLLQLVDTLDAGALTVVLNSLSAGYSGFLGYCGFTTLDRFSSELRAAVQSVASRDEVRELLTAFLLYANRLCAWAYHYFPWYLGMFYGRPDYRAGLPGRFVQQPDRI
ncbi:MAG TPA: DUF3830 domain-containing protein [bacterium]|nr:DUF3830 domain-containing protein [bacterium]